MHTLKPQLQRLCLLRWANININSRACSILGRHLTENGYVLYSEFMDSSRSRPENAGSEHQNTSKLLPSTCVPQQYSLSTLPSHILTCTRQFRSNKCTLVQAVRLCTGRTAHWGSRGIALLFLDRGTRMR